MGHEILIAPVLLVNAIVFRKEVESVYGTAAAVAVAVAAAAAIVSRSYVPHRDMV